jgi:RecG-like helicase
LTAGSVLEKPAQYLKGVGPKRAELLGRLGVVTVGDLVHHLPRAWEDRSETPPGRGVPADAPLVLRGRVMDSLQRRAGPHLVLTVARVAVPGHGEVEAVWFKRPSRTTTSSALKRTSPPDLVVGRGIGPAQVRRIDVDSTTASTTPRRLAWAASSRATPPRRL